MLLSTLALSNCSNNSIYGNKLATLSSSCDELIYLFVIQQLTTTPLAPSEGMIVDLKDILDDINFFHRRQPEFSTHIQLPKAGNLTRS